MGNIIFTIKPHSVVDLITNSSSELFVGKSKDKSIIAEVVKNIYPNYKDEYEKIKSSEELTNEEWNTFISYHCEKWSNRWQQYNITLIPGFTEEEMLSDRNSSFGKTLKWDICNDDNRQRVIDGIDPDRTMFFMFSKDDNPDWEMQEKLMWVMDRYHLG